MICIWPPLRARISLGPVMAKMFLQRSPCRRSARNALGVIVALLLITAARPGAAHPHSWVDVEVEIAFDKAGKVSGLKQSWIFDEAYTAYVAIKPARGSTKPPDAKRLAEVAREMMTNLREFNYFTRVEREGKLIETTNVTEATAILRGARLVVNFLLPLATAADVRDKPLTYAIFDPTYFVEMVHVDPVKSIRLLDAPAGCAARLRPPQPDPALAARAQALDRTESGGNELGGAFAEKVTIRCGAQP